jgi:hypothetical protein
MDKFDLKQIFKKYENGRIAIIGNSDNIYKNEYGDQIDKYDCVIRFNACYIDDKIKKHTGSKTDIVVLGGSIGELHKAYSELYDTKDKDNDNEKATKIIKKYDERFPGSDFIVSYYHTWASKDLPVLDEILGDRYFIYKIKPRPIYKKYKLGCTPTAGFVIAMASVDVKKEFNLTIDLYGFNKEEKVPIIYEYYLPKKNPDGNKIYTDRRCPPHKLLVEREMIKELVSNGTLNQY